jgi:hypothetical protein
MDSSPGIPSLSRIGRRCNRTTKRESHGFPFFVENSNSLWSNRFSSLVCAGLPRLNRHELGAEAGQRQCTYGDVSVIVDASAYFNSVFNRGEFPPQAC